MLQSPDDKHTAALPWLKLKPASHAKRRDSPVTPATLLTLPLPGATRIGVHALALHSGSAVLHEPEGKQAALSVCDKK
jgi:hypothetical protein